MLAAHPVRAKTSRRRKRIPQGQTASDGTILRTGWPNDDDQVEVLCIAKGDDYKDLNGQLINDWYGIRVAPVDVEPTALTDPRLRTAPDSKGYIGFVGISWLTGGEGKQAPSC